MRPSFNLPARARLSEMRAAIPSAFGSEASAAIGSGAPAGTSPTQRANRRKLWVFLGVFAVAGAASLIYTFARPPEYRATARVQINPGAVQVESLKPAGGSQGADAPRPLLAELQVLTSRPVLEATTKRLAEAPGNRVSSLGEDPVAALQSSLEVNSATGTDVVELALTGGDPELVADLVNGIIVTYRERLEQAFAESSTESLAQINDEVAKMEAKLQAQRQIVEDFRRRHNVVSLEREENQALSRVRGQSTALNKANETLALAEGKLRSITDAVAEGKAVVRAKDNPTLANVEQRASVIRENLRELERGYTSGYLDKDSNVRAQRERLAELDQQIAVQRKVAQEASLADAQAEVASAREAVNRINKQIADDRGAVQAFAARFNEFSVMRADLAQIESLYRDTLQRRVKLEAGERARRPSVRIVEAAAVPQQPWRPLYWRDAAISVVGSFLLALLVMWVVEIFNRADPQPTMLVPHPVAYSVLGSQLAERQALDARATPALEASPTGLLPGAPSAPRELVAEEIGRLLAEASAGVRRATVLLTCGLSPDELMALRWDDVDLAERRIRVGGASSRVLELPEQVANLLRAPAQAPATPVLTTDSNHPLTIDALTAELLYAAHDAGIERPAEITPAALRHTYIAYLARQGIRIADLTTLVGHLSPEQVAMYAALAPAGKRLSLAEVNRLMPGLPATA